MAGVPPPSEMICMTFPSVPDYRPSQVIDRCSLKNFGQKGCRGAEDGYMPWITQAIQNFFQGIVEECWLP